MIDHFLTTRQIGKVKHQVAPAVLEAMMRYSWPGNIRELLNVLERAQVLAEENTITIDDLPENMLVHPMNAPGAAGHENATGNPLHLEEMERSHVLHVLEQFKYNKVHAAKALGISRRSLYRLIEKYELERANPGSSPMS